MSLIVRFCVEKQIVLVTSVVPKLYCPPESTKYKSPSCKRKEFKFSNDDLTSIYNSRTFCLYEDVKKLQSMGFALGGSLDNAIVVKDNGVGY